MATIQFKVLTSKPDQRQYRQEEFIVEPVEPLLFEIDVPDKYVINDEDAGVTLNLEGLKWIATYYDSVFMGTSVSPQTEFDEDVQLDFD